MPKGGNKAKKSEPQASSSSGASSSAGASKNSKGNGMKVKVRHILCAKNAKILEALAKLDEGVSFAEVARTFSEDKARSGGDLGWMSRSSMVPEFEALAFSAPLNQYTQPIKTEFGYHILLVEDRQ
jgi:NIMA-interacting peptidyl-prolyl cis-trans isomerase 4